METINSQDGIQVATNIFQSLISKRVADKYNAVEFLEKHSTAIDFARLRLLLIDAITKDYSVDKDKSHNSEVAQTRSWLLRALAFISSGDNESTDLILKHIYAGHEPFDLGRYWALEGFIAGKNSEVDEVARSVFEDENHLVAMLATAFLASIQDTYAQNKIDKYLGTEDNPVDSMNTKMQLAVLRALRTVPLDFTVAALCETVKKGDYSDVTYDAIVALGKIPNDWPGASEAADVLSVCIRKLRGAPWMDSMHTGAVTALGNLRHEIYAPLIIEELADNNPAIVREAARAAEKMLGLNVTVIRVVEAASKGGSTSIDSYARALRWLNRDAVAEELATLMTSGTGQQQDIARTLLSELGGSVAIGKLRARTDIMKQYTAILEQTESKIRELFEGSLKDAKRGFDIAIIMDVTVFVVGIILLLGSAGLALYSKGDLTNWAGVGVTGGLGVLGILYGVLISNPRRQVRESVDHLMVLKIIFLAYLRRLHQADQAYTRRLLDDESIDPKQVEAFADMVGKIMNDTLVSQSQGNINSNTKPSKTDG